MNHQQMMFAINWLQVDIDMAQNAKALVELLDDIHRRAHNYQFSKPEIRRQLRGRRHDLTDYYPEHQLSNELTENRRLGSYAVDLSDWIDADSPSEKEASKDHGHMSPDRCITGCFMRDSKLEYGTGIFHFKCDSPDTDSESGYRSSPDNPCSSNSRSDKEDNNGSLKPPRLYNDGDSDRKIRVNDNITHGSACFYRDNKSDYDCLEQVSPLFAPASAFHFDGNMYETAPVRNANLGINLNGMNERAASQNILEVNVQEIALQMLQRISLNSGSYDMKNNILPRNTRSLDVMKHCTFCKRNGETKEFYSTHIVKDSRGKIICPILRKYVCPICKATGDSAHTVRYCPFKLKTASC